MISVVIAVTNESKTITTLVKASLGHPDVEEVVVVDDGSTDDTPRLAKEAGARVLHSSFLGKGSSLRDGISAAKGKYIVVLDAHLNHAIGETISRLVEPLRGGEAEMTKANAGGSMRAVCLMTARPLLQTFFPELNEIAYPMSGLWAAKRSLLQKLPFERDYSVEVGLLIGAALTDVKIAAVDVDDITLAQEPEEVMVEAALQVTRTILSQAAEHGRLKAKYVANVLEREWEVQSDLVNVVQTAESANRVAIFDMDGVLVHGSFVADLAYEVEKGSELSLLLDDPDLDEEERLTKIAALFSGVPRETFEKVANDMPLMAGAREVVAALRKAGYLVGVVSDGFHVAAEIIRCRVFADFAVANLMTYHRGKATGRVRIAPAFSHPKGCPKHRFCKSNVLRHLMDIMHIGPERVLAVGNSENDVCMLELAGHSVAFRPNRSVVRQAADLVVEDALTDSLAVLEPASIS